MMKNGQKVTGIRKLFSRLRKKKRKQTAPIASEENNAGAGAECRKSNSDDVDTPRTSQPSGGVQDLMNWFDKLERNEEQSRHGAQERSPEAVGVFPMDPQPVTSATTDQGDAEAIRPVHPMTERQCVSYEYPVVLPRSPQIVHADINMPSTSQAAITEQEIDTMITTSSKGKQGLKSAPNEIKIKRTKPSLGNECSSPRGSIQHSMINEGRQSNAYNTMMSVDSVTTDTLMSECNTYQRDIVIEGRTMNSTTASAAADALTIDQRRPIAIVPPQIREDSLAVVSANSIGTSVMNGSPASHHGLSPRIPSEVVYIHQLQRSQLQQQQRIEQELLDLEQRREIDDIGDERSVDYSDIGTMDTDILLQPLEVINPSSRALRRESSSRLSQRHVQLEETTDHAIRDVNRRSVPSDNVASSINGRFRRTRSAPRAAQPHRPGSYSGTHFSSFEEADASSDTEDDWLVARLHNLRSDLIRLPGVLVLGVRRGCLVIYLSRDRPNIPGVHDFMRRKGITDREYECKLMPSRFRPMDTSADTRFSAIVRG